MSPYYHRNAFEVIDKDGALTFDRAAATPAPWHAAALTDGAPHSAIGKFAADEVMMRTG
jgi:hypothetical protein